MKQKKNQFKLSLGQKIAIEEIEMTLLEIKQSFRGITYKFAYFNSGHIMEAEFCWEELQALGAVLLVEGNDKKLLTSFSEMI